MGLAIRSDDCAIDFVSVGALVTRLDPGIVPFRRARNFAIHVSGGEYNVAANLAACFGLKTGIATAMVDHGIGELVRRKCGKWESPRFTNTLLMMACGARTSPRCTVIGAMVSGRRSFFTIGPMRRPRCSSREILIGRESSPTASAGFIPGAFSLRSPKPRPRWSSRGCRRLAPQRGDVV